MCVTPHWNGDKGEKEVPKDRAKQTFGNASKLLIEISVTASLFPWRRSGSSTYLKGLGRKDGAPGFG